MFVFLQQKNMLRIDNVQVTPNPSALYDGIQMDIQYTSEQPITQQTMWKITVFTHIFIYM